VIGGIFGGLVVAGGGTALGLYIKRRRGSGGIKSESRRNKRQRSSDFTE
jgi:hypothetical protein